MKYKQLLSEHDFLKVKSRARALDGTDLVAIQYDKRQIVFKTRSSKDKRVIWVQTIEITDAYIDNVLSKKTFRSVQDLILNSDLKIDCTCPAYLYWGYKYKAWKNGYGINKETRRPVVRNPHERGYVCFTESAMVLTPDGEVPISQIKPGSFVISHKNRPCKVSCVLSRPTSKLINITYNSSVVTCTESHPFFVLRDNQVSLLPAKELKTTDYLLTFGEGVVYDSMEYALVPIENIEPIQGKQTVYNLTVDDDATFVVNGVIVHNCKHLYLVLETYPFWSASLASKFKKYFDQVQEYNDQHPEVADSVRHAYHLSVDKKRIPLKLSNPRLK